jgi:hypothetical protein
MLHALCLGHASFPRSETESLLPRVASPPYGLEGLHDVSGKNEVPNACTRRPFRLALHEQSAVLRREVFSKVLGFNFLVWPMSDYRLSDFESVACADIQASNSDAPARKATLIPDFL